MQVDDREEVVPLVKIPGMKHLLSRSFPALSMVFEMFLGTPRILMTCTGCVFLLVLGTRIKEELYFSSQILLFFH